MNSLKKIKIETCLYQLEDFIKAVGANEPHSSNLMDKREQARKALNHLDQFIKMLHKKTTPNHSFPRRSCGIRGRLR